MTIMYYLQHILYGHWRPLWWMWESFPQDFLMLEKSSKANQNRISSWLWCKSKTVGCSLLNLQKWKYWFVKMLWKPALHGKRPQVFSNSKWFQGSITVLCFKFVVAMLKRLSTFSDSSYRCMAGALHLLQYMFAAKTVKVAVTKSTSIVKAHWRKHDMTQRSLPFIFCRTWKWIAFQLWCFILFIYISNEAEIF